MTTLYLSGRDKAMSKYAIRRDKQGWFVCQGISIVYRGESKAECLAWCEENK